MRTFDRAYGSFTDRVVGYNLKYMRVEEVRNSLVPWLLLNREIYLGFYSVLFSSIHATYVARSYWVRKDVFYLDCASSVVTH
jgi:hypothetical protein